ncbi:MAG: molybdopterin-dependent oxidoreductase, partial [Armatimonadetes bacterium]|nr:molybdopterin-dependent oxidoreductase [Armatimonadota bacterium]
MAITIDGRLVECSPEENILEVARRNGVDIPSLCYESAVHAWGACRLCIVEVDGLERPVPACLTRAEEGLDVRTESPRLTAARRVILELLFSQHAGECESCNLSPACRLFALAQRYGARRDRFDGSARHTSTVELSPLVMHDPSKCILCTLCVRVCTELEAAKALRLVGHGLGARVAPAAGGEGAQPCHSCGRCVAVCPAGALTDKKMATRPRGMSTKTVASVCPHCSLGCPVQIEVAQDRIIEVRPAAAPAGDLCTMGRYGWDFVHSPARLTSPLIKLGEASKMAHLRPVSWDEALGMAADRLRRIRDRCGPQAIAVIGSCRSTNEANYLLQKFARAVLGTNNLDSGAGMRWPPQLAGDDLAVGTGIMSNSLDEISQAQLIVLVSSDPEQTHPVFSARLKRAARQGTRIIVVDPRLIDLVACAEMHLRLRVGAEVTLVNGLVKVIIEEGLYDHEFVEAHTEGFKDLAGFLQGLKMQAVCRLTGIEERQIREAARTIAAADSVMFFYTTGAHHPMCGHETGLALRNLALVTGNIGRAGAGVNALRLQNNAQGACDMGVLPGVLPGYQKIADDAVVGKFERAWSVTLPRQPGISRTDLVDAILGGQVKALYVMGENPAAADPNPARTRLALETLELLIVQDVFPTETAEMAHIVLPAAAWAEVDGTYTAADRRVQRVRAALPPPGEAQPDWLIICRLSDHMGYPMSYSGPEDIWAEVASLCPVFAGISYSRLERGGLPWPCTGTSDPGRKHLHAWLRQNNTREQLRPVQPSGHLPGADLDEHYPMLLTTGKRLYHYQPGT